jgi:hypothetical protein
MWRNIEIYHIFVKKLFESDVTNINYHSTHTARPSNPDQGHLKRRPNDGAGSGTENIGKTLRKNQRTCLHNLLWENLFFTA